MSEIIEKLKNLAHFDASIVRAIAERNQTIEAIKARKIELQQKQTQINKIEDLFKSKHDQYNKEEKRLRDERSKLENRRGALESFTNYKLMEAAEKEIKGAEAEISKQEELILTHIDEADEIETKLNELKDNFTKFSKESAEFIDDSEAKIESLNEREADYRTKREAAAKLLDAGSLAEYDKVVKKYPTDPIVGVKGKICQGCYVSLPPVQLSEVAAGNKLINCRGCKRLIYLVTE